MPRIFDNIEQPLLQELRAVLESANRADFCVGYLRLTGWQQIDDLIERFAGGDGACCRLLVGMQTLPKDEFSFARALNSGEQSIGLQEAKRRIRAIASEFRNQLISGVPSNRDQEALRRLSEQLKSKKVILKLFLRHPLHAKLYLVHRPVHGSSIMSYLGSSNLTISGLRNQGELNVDVQDPDACTKLQNWFDDRWTDNRCVDISQALAEIIDESWVQERLPYHIYLKIAYHLSQEARAGISQFTIPREFQGRLLEFQEAAVKIAARHVNKRGGVLIGDVVGLGKTLIGAALARIFEDDYGISTLIICPKNLVQMWQRYVDEYGLRAKIVPYSQVIKRLPEIPARFRLVMIDESHNLRNQDGKQYRAIQQYIQESDSKCILLSATPYNKSRSDLAAQLKLFVPEDRDLGIRPEQLIAQLGGGAFGEVTFKTKYQCPVRSLSAFEKSDYADDWRELIKQYMVRRTRSFIRENYAKDDGRKYLEFPDGSRSYFPERSPKTIKFTIGHTKTDQYACLYSDDVVRIVNALNLPRYGLVNYLISSPRKAMTTAEEQQIRGLSRAGRRLMGFCRTNLFKRLESSGASFIQSIDRHILRNYIFLHAIQNGLDIPIGTQDAELLDSRNRDEDSDSAIAVLLGSELEDEHIDELESDESLLREDVYRSRAAEIYQTYATVHRNRFKWLRSDLFAEQLEQDLAADAQALARILNECGDWNAKKDQKLLALIDLLTWVHPDEKVLIFTQFADTARYLANRLEAEGIDHVGVVTGQSKNPTAIAERFSPRSNKQQLADEELRVLIATDILSEGQNLQDCAIVVNYDLPWAIIRLIQRAGRVDRIGQQSSEILCYSFLPADGVERIIRLRSRLRDRLKENAEVVGTDEEFFEGEESNRLMLDLYHEKSGVLDETEDLEVDLTSEAYQIWNNAITHDPSLKETIERIPNVAYATRAYTPTKTHPEGVLLYMQTAEGNDALAWVDRSGNPVTQSQLAILRAAQCELDTPAIACDPQHHQLVATGAAFIAKEEKSSGGQLGSTKGARARTYERLRRYLQEVKGTLFDTDDLNRAFENLLQYPLCSSAIDKLNRQLKSGIDDPKLAELVVDLHKDGRLCLVQEEAEQREPRIICSMGLFDLLPSSEL
ncbi:helicase domain-containing protein [Leptolyngbya sp. NIES-3755]|nr:helicase domain-containing protein [Leptolyngbya sp. NIES-3755]